MSHIYQVNKDKPWIHRPELLTDGFVSYNVKFLGCYEVEEPKGLPAVEGAVRKLKFANLIKRSEGHKLRKALLQISVVGVRLLDCKTKEILHSCPLERISFCAHHEADRHVCTFVCKNVQWKKHMCFALEGEKCAEKVTLTIGQAFDLAYLSILKSRGRDVEARQHVATLVKRISGLEMENTDLKTKLEEIMERVNGPNNDFSMSGSATIHQNVSHTPPLASMWIGGQHRAYSEQDTGAAPQITSCYIDERRGD
ncbi:PTB domain-containing engulfment adapter protein 1-like isoform X3 [Petromyzon marinus]|uniref:PTB domain-containing engulfment adapter protein 1-like isoform X3 n=1 Tax=Petromyzon marinus TaxID=7757 RepID=UPI003F7201AC